MKLINYLLIVLFFIASCTEDKVDPSIPAENYGDGMYIVTDKGVSFYNNTDSLAEVQNQIFKSVNNSTIINPKKIKFKGTKAYIIADDYILTANVKTFEKRDEINGFSKPVDLDFISHNRLLVVDKGDSKVKVVDLISLDISEQIECGDSTKPVFIISNSKTSFIMNAGGSTAEIKDSTVIAIDYRDNLEAISNFSGNLLVGYNPNSAVFSGNLKVLCKGIYDLVNPINNTESSFSILNQFSHVVYSTNTLIGIYNARNLVSNKSASVLFFTASNGIYTINPNGVGVSQIDPIVSDILFVQSEQYNLTDSTTAISNMLYVNDTYNSPNTIYKYNLVLSSYVDTIIVDGNVRDINFY
jgi:hypothetical protein